MTPSEESAWTARMKVGPTGLVVVHPQGSEPMTPGQLLAEFASNLAAALVVAVLLTTTRADLGLLGRVGFVMLVALTGWLSIMVSYWNWYGFPTAFTLAEAANELIGWGAAGLAMGWILRPRAERTAPPPSEVLIVA